LSEKLEEISINTSEQINELFKKQVDLHNSFKEAESRQNKFLAYASALIAIIAALGGFFGFKSINDIKKNVLAQAETVAIKEARETSQRTTDGSVSRVIKSIASENFNDNFSKAIKSYEDQLENLSEKVDECFLRKDDSNDDDKTDQSETSTNSKKDEQSTTFKDEQL
jgi:mevalonate kinase